MNLALTTCGALLLSHAAATTGPERAPANELRREYVAADAGMVFHLDADALKTTTLWRFAMDEAGPFGVQHELDELEEFKAEFGLDPLTDVKSVTVYGSSLEQDPSAVLIRVSERLDDALAVLKMQDGYRTIREGGFELHTFADGGDDVVAFIQELRGGDRLVVLSESVEQTIRAARVVRGDAASLADDAGAALRAKPAPGSFLYVEVAGGLPGMHEFEPASQVFGLAQGIQFDVGEAGGSLFIHAALATGSNENAMDVADMVDGLLALARIALRAEDWAPREATNLLRALRVNARGNMVTIDFEYDVRALLETLKSLDEGDDYEDYEEDFKGGHPLR